MTQRYLPMKRIFYLLTASLLFTTSVLAQDFWTGLNGPFGGTINDLVSPSAGVFIASTANGVYRSADSGDNWTRVTLGTDNSFSDLEIDPSSSGNKIYAATPSGARVYVSADAGVTWSQLTTTGVTSAVTKIEVASGGTTIYMTDTGFRVLKSTTSGAAFSIFQTLSGSPIITDLDLDNLGNVYVSTNGNGIRVSNGTGGFVTSTGSLTGGSIVYSTVIKSSTEIYCLSSNGVHKSVNVGVTYALSSTGLADASYSGIIDLDATGNIFICNNDPNPKKIYTSTAASAGASWSFVTSPFWALPVTASVFQSSTTFHLGLGNIGVMKLASATMSIVSNGIKALQTANSKVFQYENAVYVSGSNVGYFRSFNDATWSLDANGVTNRSISGFVKLSDNSVLAYGSGGVIRTPNSVASWTLQNSQAINELVTSNGINLFSYSGTNTLLNSINQGVTWTTQTITGLPGTTINKIDVDAANNVYFKVANEIWKVPFSTTTATKLTALTATTIQDFQVVGNSVFVLGNGNTLFISSDNGTSFISKNTPASATSLWVHSATHMFLRTTLNNFYLSNDAGGVWTIHALLDAQATATDAFVSDKTFLYVATTNSVLHKSTNYILPPAAPTNLVTIGKSFDRVELMWTDNANNEERFLVEVSIGNNQNFAPAELGFTITPVFDTYNNLYNVNVSSLAKNTLYFFRAKAVNTAGSSAYTNEISVTTTDQCATTIPNNRSWTAVAVADPGSTPNPGGPFTSAIVNITSIQNSPNNFLISAFDFGVSPTGTYGNARIAESCGQVFNYELSTIANGNGTWNGTNTLVLKWQDSPYNLAGFQGTTTFTLNANDPIPAVPQLNVYLYSGTEILLNWNTIPFATQYEVERTQTSGSGYTTIATVNYPAVTYLDKNLTTGQSYYYRIKSKNNTGLSGPSSEAGILLQNGLFRPVENDIQLNFENQQGVSWGDLDGDGDEDIASPSFTNNAQQTVPPVFYENMGNGKDFTRRDLSVLQNENTAVSRGINLFDFNNDGKMDMYITRSANAIPDLLLINNGAWDFTKNVVTPTEPYNTSFRSSAAADYDKDGLVDVFVGNSNAQTLNNLLLRNSNGTSLIEIAAGALTSDLGDSRNVSWIDYDNDNDQDMFVLNSTANPPYRLYKNNGDGTFTKVTGLIFDTEIITTPRTVSWGDIDNDGDFDLYVGSQSTSVSPNANDRLYQNNGNGTFTSIGGVVAESSTATFGSCFGDIDNDGDLDLIAINNGANSIFLNNGSGIFSKYAVQELATHPTITEIGGALADFDKDGFLDFYPSKGQTTAADLPNFLYRNLLTASASRAWIELKLIGTLSNKSAIGARVTVTTAAPSRTQIREVSTRTGYGSANSLIVHVGLGTSTAISTIQVKWPSGFIQTITNPSINQVLTVTEDVRADLTFTAPTSLDSKFGTTVFAVGATANFGTVSSVVLSYRKISGSAFTDLEGTFNPANSKWEFTVNQSFFDGNGLEYYITAKTGSSAIGRLPLIATTNFYTYLNYQEADNSIPAQHIGLGGTANDWKVFSIPFDLGSNNNVTTIFDELAGLVDKVDWRMIAYKDDKAWGQFPTDFSTIGRGKGYFINIKNSVDIKVPTATSSNNRKSLFTMDLKTGWNQIGNPYLSRISWTDVVAFNNLTGTAIQLKTFSNGSYNNATTLDPFEGGFVLAESNVTVTIPFEGQIAPGGRKSQSNLTGEDWMLPITLKQGSVENSFGGIGMRESALLSFDEFDDFNAPPFIDFIEMNFDHPEHFVKKFARDVVPVQEAYTWPFNVESNMNGLAELTWNYIGANNDNKEIFLFDEGLQRIINMKEINHYSFQPTISKSFKVYYGENLHATIKPTRALLGKAYPNPSRGETTVDFTLAESRSNYQVKLEVFDMMGRKITTLASGSFDPGFYSATMDSRQLEIASGLYTILLSIAGEKGQEIQSQKIIINK